MTLPFCIVGLCDTREYTTDSTLTTQAPIWDGHNLSHPLELCRLPPRYGGRHMGV